MDIDTLLLLGVSVAVLAAVYGIVRVVRTRIRKKKEQREAIQRRLDMLRDDSWKRVDRVNATPLRSAIASKPAVAPIKSSYAAPATTQSASTTTTSSSDDGFVTGMLTGMLVDNVLNSLPHKSGGSSPIDFPKESSVGVSKSESSWGFDDSDSRKSISDSMSSSSDSWSSSSDSGPSSDW